MITSPIKNHQSKTKKIIKRTKKQKKRENVMLPEGYVGPDLDGNYVEQEP